jgi:alpha-N-arabinofuranosidase
MANLAQTVNVLQAVILTEEEKMILTPTYHVMEMYKVHQDARLVPSEIVSNDFTMDAEKIPAVTVSASIDDAGKLHVSLTNIDHKNSQKVEIELRGFQAKEVYGRILTSDKIQDHNSFDEPEKVCPEKFKGTKITKDKLIVDMPSKSVVVLELNK